MSYADIHGITLTANQYYVTFEGSNMKGADMHDAAIEAGDEIKFKEVNAPKIDMHDASFKATDGYVSFGRTNLAESDMRNIDIESENSGVYFSYADMHDADA